MSRDKYGPSAHCEVRSCPGPARSLTHAHWLVFCCLVGPTCCSGLTVAAIAIVATG